MAIILLTGFNFLILVLSNVLVKLLLLLYINFLHCLVTPLLLWFLLFLLLLKINFLFKFILFIIKNRFFVRHNAMIVPFYTTVKFCQLVIKIAKVQWISLWLDILVINVSAVVGMAIIIIIIIIIDISISISISIIFFVIITVVFLLYYNYQLSHKKIMQ